MIGSLRGTVLEHVDEGTVLVEAGGVGYLVNVTRRTLAELKPTSTVFLYVHHHIREDGQTLYGFLAREERALFGMLIGTHGIGPSLALAVLHTHAPEALADIVANGDLAALTKVPGVGRKTAERLLVELRNRLPVPRRDPERGEPTSSAVSEVRDALAGLGYGELEIREALSELPGEGDAAELLRAALQLLGARRA